MRAILLDPNHRSITEVDHDGDFRDIQRLIDAQPFDVRPLHGSPGNVIYFDDEFLLHDDARDPQVYMDIVGLPDCIGGKALILGTNGAGESISTTLTVEKVENMVSYRIMKLVGWTPMQSETIGGVNVIRGPRPIFDSDPTPGVKRDPATILKDQEEYSKAGSTRDQIMEFFKKGGVA